MPFYFLLLYSYLKFLSFWGKGRFPEKEEPTKASRNFLGEIDRKRGKRDLRIVSLWKEIPHAIKDHTHIILKYT